MFLEDRDAVVLSSQNQDGGTAWKNKSKKPWACIFTLPACGNRCRFSDSLRAQFLFASACTIENKIERKSQTLRWRLLRWRLTLSTSGLGHPHGPDRRLLTYGRPTLTMPTTKPEATCDTMSRRAHRASCRQSLGPSTPRVSQ